MIAQAPSGALPTAHEPQPASSLEPLQRALRLLADRGIPATPLPALGLVAESLPGTPAARLRFEDWDIGGRARLRFTGIDGPSTMIFSLMIFPTDAGTTPVFGAEFVVFGRLLRAAVVDVQPLTPAARNEASYLRLVERLAGRWPELMATGPLPEWCEAHFTAHAVFVLRESATLLEPAHEAFDDYMAAYAELLARHQLGSTAEGDAALRHYKDHHIANTPGRRYLTRLFGGDWTEWFLRERMYAD